MLDAFRDLVLGSTCLGCGRPGRLLCGVCLPTLDPHPAPAWPTPRPPGLTEPWAAAPYAGLVRELVIGHKERRLLALAGPLGELLARAVEAAATELLPIATAVGETVPLLLVPVPSRPRTVRQRGHDPTLALTRVAASWLALRGRPARCVPLLRTRQGLADQSGLGAEARAVNLAGAFRVPAGGLRRLARAGRAGHVVVCDDVLTTGATAAEAARALSAVGLPPLAVVAVAATVRRLPGPRRTGGTVPRSPANG